jgi:flagellar hook-basal body complex protein FliE
MDFAIGKAIEHVKMLEPLGGASPQGPEAGLQFGAEMARALQEVKATQSEARSQMQAFLNGEQSDLHQVALAAQKAELQFETMLEFRNKFLQAYQEMMRM